MDCVGTWTFHSVGTFNENFQMVYLNAEDYLASPLPEFIDKSDTEEVESELRERKSTVGMCVKVCEDGNLYILTPIPDGVSEKDVEEAVAAGQFILVDGMLAEKPMRWEIRDGELWYDTGLSGEFMGETADPWCKALDEDGLFNFANFRFCKQ